MRWLARWLTGGFIFLLQTISLVAEPLLDNPLVTRFILEQPYVIQALNAAPQQQMVLKLQDFTNRSSLRLRGSFGSTSIDFGTRSDQFITTAKLIVHYTHSPSLLSDISHIKVYLNDEIVGVLEAQPKLAGQRISRSLNIDPRLFSDYNRLRFEFVGHYALECEDPLHSSLWADISTSSQLELGVQNLALKNQLSLFPEPFFDQKDSKRLRLPFVFTPNISTKTLRAAGILASWFGAQAEWRGSIFPVLIDELPNQHAVVFATNQQRPTFLQHYPEVQAATIEMVTHPHNRYAKLLLIHAPTEDQLITAVKGLVMGQAVLTGHAATIESVTMPEARLPYDAPRWISTTRPVSFGELVDNIDQLQVSGYQPDTIRLNLRIPADLFTWRSVGIPVDLKYRYTPPITLDESRLNVSINEQFIEAFHLDESGEGGGSNRMRVPLIDELLFGPSPQLLLPAFKLGARNQLQLKFSFARLAEKGCKGDPLFNVKAAVDANSTVDFSGMPHYALLPNLNLFANSGFPYTRLADLSETVFVIGDDNNPEEIYSLLNVLGHLGASTGYPALRFEIFKATKMPDISAVQDKDIILIGALPQSIGEKPWQQNFPLLLNDTRKAMARSEKAQFTWLDFNTDEAHKISNKVVIDSPGSLSALVGFESPYSSGRSVISLLANNKLALVELSESLSNFSLVNQFAGTMAIFKQGEIITSDVGDSYTTGELPTFTLVWYHLSNYPLVLAVVAVLAVLLIALALWQVLVSLAKHRVKGNAGHD